MDLNNTIDQIYYELGIMFRPLSSIESAEDLIDFAARIGLDFDIIFIDTDPLSDIATAINQTYRIIQPIIEQESLSISDIDNLIDAVSNLIDAVNQLNDLQIRDDIDQALQEPGRRLLEYLLIEYLRNSKVDWLGWLTLFRIIREGDWETSRLPEVDFTRLLPANFKSNSFLEDFFNWGAANFNSRELLEAIRKIFLGLGFPTTFNTPDASNAIFFEVDPDREYLDSELQVPLFAFEENLVKIVVGFSILPIPDQTGRLPGIVFLPFGTGNISEQIELTDDWRFAFEATASAPNTYGIIVRPDEFVIVNRETGVDIATLELRARIYHTRLASQKTSVLKFPNVIDARIGWQGVHFMLKHGVDTHVEIGTTLDIDLNLFSASEDGFLSSFISSNGITTSVSLSPRWSPSRGLSIDGSTLLNFNFPIHKKLGAINILNLGLGIDPMGSEGFRLSAFLDGKLKLGPITAIAKQFGANLNTSFDNGLFGFRDIDFSVKFPSGLGLSINTDIITGGGFVEFFPEQGRYSGMLELKLLGIGVTAIGILDTKDSQGRALPPPGFSFLIIIMADLPLIQLGFGFTLNGVGGMLGVHRTTDVEALKEGIKTGAVDSIMFPKNPLDNMPKIISDIRNVFPPKMNQFIVGPMMQIGWGTPTVFEIEMGLVLDLPEPVRLIVLGQLYSVLPSVKVPIVVLNVDLVGILDFGQKQLYIEANVRDSRLAAFALKGGMVFYLNWGNRPNFILSIGGFHPDYTQAPSLPPIDRLSASIGLGDYVKIGIEGYLAVTANSFQFGAKAELFLGLEEASIEGILSFDALLIFSPFYFRFDFTYKFAVKIKGKTLLGISFTGTLEGPNPFRIAGEGCISILFLDLCLDFNFPIGKKKAEDPLPEKRIWPELLSAVEAPSNWEVQLPEYNRIGVSISRDPLSEKEILVHPMGYLTFRQNVLPLNSRLEKFGEFSVGDYHEFEVTSANTRDDQPLAFSLLKDYFAIGQYENLTKHQKFTRKPFELKDAGLSFSGAFGIEDGDFQTQRRLEYEQCIIDERLESRPNGTPIIFDDKEQLVADISKPNGNLNGAKYSNTRRSGQFSIRE